MKGLYPLFGDKLSLFGGGQTVRPLLGDSVSVSKILYVWNCFRGVSYPDHRTTVHKCGVGGGVGKAPITVHALLLYSALFFSKTFQHFGPSSCEYKFMDE
jgi:hypothetical protein